MYREDKTVYTLVWNPDKKKFCLGCCKFLAVLINYQPSSQNKHDGQIFQQILLMLFFSFFQPD
jgi:hypothetical protein